MFYHASSLTLSRTQVVLCPSERYYQARGRQHQPLLERAQQMLRLLARWLPTRSVVVVADQAFSALAFLDAVRQQVAVITRLRLDAASHSITADFNRRIRERKYL